MRHALQWQEAQFRFNRSGARALTAVILTANGLLAGCVSVKSFVDPNGDSAKYEELVKPSEPLKLKVSVEFQRNGEHIAKVDSSLQDKVERILRASGVIVPAPDATTGEITVVLNNIGNRAAASAKGVATGLTFGLIGSTVQDAYEMTVKINANGRIFRREGLHHSIYTMVGNTTPPTGVQTVVPNLAVDRVVEQMLLVALKEFQMSNARSTQESRFLPSLVTAEDALFTLDTATD